MAETSERATPAPRRRPRNDPWFFLAMSVVLAALVFAGFSTSFYLKPMIGSSSASGAPAFTPWLYVHGFALTAWFALLIAQSFLVHRNQLSLHRRLGFAGLAIAATIVLTTFPVLLDLVPRQIRAGAPAEQIEMLPLLIFFNVFQLVAFGGLVFWAYLSRKRGDVHKRLLIIASISLMPAAVTRVLSFFPSLPVVPLSLGIPALLMLTVVFWDFAQLKRAHPATLCAIGISLGGYIGGLALGMTPWAQAVVAGLV